MSNLNELMHTLNAAALASGRHVFALLWEMLILRLSTGRLGLSEYFDFRLYQNDLSIERKKAFGGYRLQAILEEILVDDYARFLSLDKVSMYMLLSAYGLPVPKLLAIFRSRRTEAVHHIETSAALVAFLSAPGALPVYLKPSLGSYGRGNALIQSAKDNILLLGDGSEVPAQTFCDSLDNAHSLGWILQEPLTPHHEIRERCGNKISGVRIHTFLTPDGPKLIKAIWKINIGREDSDNFRHGASGNLLAAIDAHSGRIMRVVSKTGLEQFINPPHPVTGKEIVGFTLPHWNEIKQLVCDAQRAFPCYLCPGWDIAVCESGPKILEVNFMGDIDLSQHAYRQGFIDDEFLRLMQERGLHKLLNESANNRSRSKKNGRIGTRRHHWEW